MKAKNFNHLNLIPLAVLGFYLSGCTGQLPGSFRLAQQEEVFSSQLQINTKIDLLWVVDNSSSMDVSQEKLRAGFDGFARKYMQPTWDIRVAVITTDSYLAHSQFGEYLNRVIPGTIGWQSPYMRDKVKPVTNPIYNPVTQRFDGGVRFGDLIPIWGPNYARLLPGFHDGPIQGLCFEGLPYFLRGVTQCAVRDDLSPNVGVEKCLNPGSGESSISQCVNTVENNTVRSGRAIVSTAPPAGLSSAELAAWSNQLVRDFRVNVTTGSVGHGSERGFSSLLQLISDNESSETAFFRKDSLRGIIFVSDEDDQSMEIPELPPVDFSPWTYYKCDQASLEALNPTKIPAISGMNGYCCSDPSKNCRYGSEGTSCAPKTVAGLTYTPSICPREDKLIPVESVKAELDQFFRTLDQVGADAEEIPSYFIVSIVPETAQSIQELQVNRDLDDAAVGGTIRTWAVDRGDRYLQFGELVGNGSLGLNIGEDDYSPVLEKIGKSIIEHKSVFTLVRPPTGTEEMIVRVFRGNGTVEVIPPSKFVVSGKQLIITDLDLVLGFTAADQISINYQPKTLY